VLEVVDVVVEVVDAGEEFEVLVVDAGVVEELVERESVR
jgi:hypothetical protein